MKIKSLPFVFLCAGSMVFSAPLIADEILETEIADVELSEVQQEPKPVEPAKTGAHMPAAALRKTLERAYEYNPSLKGQRRAFQSAVEQVPQALSGALPSVTAGYSKGRQRTRTAGSDWSSSDSDARTLTATQPIFRGGTTYANVKTARRQVDAEMARLTQVEQAVLLEAVTAYMDVVRATAVLDLSVKNRDVLEKQEEAASQRFEVGEDTRTDVAQSQARVALASSDVINSKSQLESFKAVYREVVGALPESITLPENLPETPKTLESFIEKAMVHSPVIKEAEALKEAADYVVDANIGTLLPSVNLQGSVARQEGVGTFGNTDFDQDEILISASLPLYTGGQRYSLVRQAKENYQQRRFQLMETSNQVRRQAVSAWEDLLAATSTIDSNNTAVSAAEVALDGVRQEQQYGSRTTLDVLDAERELFNAQVQLVIAKRNKVVAAYSVLAVLGQLTAKEMSLDVPYYDADGYYDDTEYQLIGF